MRQILQDFLIFTYKQAYACLFGGFLIAMIVLTRYTYPFEGVLLPYDFLFLSAIIFQLVLVMTKLESWREILVIGVFHLVALGMEIFKTHPSIGSWSYPGEAHFIVFGVPLFAGFMYSAVGSYIARVWRIFEFRFDRYPKRIYTIVLALAIYANFFTHHFIVDLRYVIILFILFLFGRTTIYYKPGDRYYSMNLVLGFALVALFIWIGENIGTYTHTWIYPSQAHGWHMVGTEKITAWFLLVIIS
jgi:uncharacterized membrane protein YoaT (DUF817 family)